MGSYCYYRLHSEENSMQYHKAGSTSIQAKPFVAAGYLSILRFIWARLGQEKIIQLASSLTFSTVLAIVPLLCKIS
jgi:uncharacterized BrkB/YihY/UPF0761 family membrane protein